MPYVLFVPFCTLSSLRAIKESLEQKTSHEMDILNFKYKILGVFMKLNQFLMLEMVTETLLKTLFSTLLCSWSLFSSAHPSLDSGGFWYDISR